MAKSSFHSRGGGGEDITPNLTSLIDVCWNLVLFFLLAGTMASQEAVPMVLADPYKSMAIPYDKLPVNRIIVQVTSTATELKDNSGMTLLAKAYRIGTKELMAGDMDALTRELLARKDTVKKNLPKGEDLIVEVRADARVDYSQVSPVLMSAAMAGIPKVYITALMGNERGE